MLITFISDKDRIMKESKIRLRKHYEEEESGLAYDFTDFQGGVSVIDSEAYRIC